MQNPFPTRPIEHDQDHVDFHRPPAYEFRTMQPVGEPCQSSLLGRTQSIRKTGCLCMPRLDFYDDYAATIGRLDQQVQFTSPDSDVASKNAMPTTPKPAGGNSLPSTSCSS